MVVTAIIEAGGEERNFKRTFQPRLPHNMPDMLARIGKGSRFTTSPVVAARSQA